MRVRSHCFSASAEAHLPHAALIGPHLQHAAVPGPAAAPGATCALRALFAQTEAPNLCSLQCPGLERPAKRCGSHRQRGQHTECRCFRSQQAGQHRPAGTGQTAHTLCSASSLSMTLPVAGNVCLQHGPLSDQGRGRACSAHVRDAAAYAPSMNMRRPVTPYDDDDDDGTAEVKRGVRVRVPCC